MRLLEIGMGCSMHEGVNGLNTLAVRRTPGQYAVYHALQQ